MDINPGLSVSLDSGNLNVSGVFLNPSTGGRGKVRGSGANWGAQERFLQELQECVRWVHAGVCVCSVGLFVSV